MLENLKREQNLNEGAKITVCESNVELAASTGTGGASGTHGYINHNSGWADAESTMRYLRKKVQDLRRCAFLTVPVERLLFSDDQSRCTGVQMEDGNFLTADLIIVAAGAWSPTLVDLRGRVMATGQVLTYIPVTPSEAEILSKTPVQLNMSSGLFIIPPPSQSALPSPPSAHCKGQLYLKIARHGYGYTNPKMIPHPEDPSLKSIEVSIPHTNPNTPKAKQKIPEEGQQALRSFLHLVIPPSSPLAAIADRPSEFSRICHYADTPDGHFLISYHPAYNKSLFIATGGSGHGFKFLPVIGEKIVDCLVGKCPVDFADKWSWGEPVEGPWESDGSRGGEKGMVLVDEMKKGGMKI
ncbi:DAO-domain-containing protein [Tothia fuscella]|uniref:DAO-domain-containing protein n=1 Tax=Tothia fuscella TaxID=1048955 RepID=A0A9P4NEZ0_9PEZI|nr:DAO-domain-containing protein [Tothia fuscella]